ncbi:MAG: ATP-binding protein, partial [Microcoleus sp.]
MIKLLGYEIIEQIYAGSQTLVYRGRRQSDRQPAVIKQLNNPYPSFSQLLQFRNQYTITKNLEISGIIRPYSLESVGNSYALVMEDCGSISLRDYTRDRTLAIAQVLEIAVQVAQTLHELHQNRVIHKDIKPANILIHPETKQVKLIDFSIASLLPKETQEIKNPNVLEGTLAYLAPEQTGRMNRGIDYRSDFYALGVTLFELLTGQLPFESDDPMELVHCHIAKQPPSLSNRQQATDNREEGKGNRQQATGNREEGKVNRQQATGNREEGKVNRQQAAGNREEIPLVLENIVMKLMAKNAEDRYQSALGLKYDLEICLHQQKETGKIEVFEIGQRDLCDRFLIPEKLYGRETEVQTLLDAFDRVASGSAEMMLVAGFSGIGKTAVVNEVHKPIVRQRGYFIKGKYDQFQRNIPFSAFVQAFRDLMEQLSSESDARLQIWKTKILEAVGDSGQVLIDVIPELEQIIGTQPPATELSGTAAQNRFNRLMQKFVQVFTTIEHPLAIFLDDLQWADSASLKLLQLLMNETGYLLILGAYRDNEVSPAHPLMIAVYEIVKTGATVNTIDLQALSLADLNQLVADTLNCELSIAQPLTGLVYQKTRGNPFFATQFLKALHEDKLITFDPPVSPLTKGSQCVAGGSPVVATGVGREGGWQCDIAGVRALAITDDVVEFMALQLLKLPAQTQNILKLAACIGTQFDLNTLAIISEQSQTDVATALWKALQEGLVLPITETYKFFQDADIETPAQEITVPYKFLHDRVQQAAYSLIPEEQKQVTHLKIGQLMLEKIPQLTLKDKIFHVVNHLNIGSELIYDPTQREQLAILNLRAGQKAKVATAYADAVKYLNFSLALLEAEKWQSQYDLMLSVHIEAAEAEYLNTNFQKLASLAQIVLEKAKTVLDEMKIYELQIQSYQLQSMMLKAIDTGLKALEKLGVFLSASICDRPMPDLPRIEDLDSIPEMKDPGKLAALRIMMALYPPIYIAKPDSIEPLILTMVKLCIEGGHSALAAYSYVLYGIILCAKKGSIDRGYYAGQISLKLLDKFQATELKAKIYVLFNAHIRFWKEPVRSTINAYLEGYQSGLKTGDIEWASYNCKHYCKNLFISGENLELVEKEQALYQSVILKNNHEFALNYTRIWMQAALILQGKATDNLKPIGKDFDESLLIPLWESNNNYMSLFALYLVKANLAYLFDDVTAALDRAFLAKEYIGASLGLITIGVYNFYLSLILLAAYPQVETSKQQQYLSDVKENQENLKEWSVHAPQNFRHKYLLVQAEMARVLGKKLKAVDLYDRAISLAKENQYIQEEALANELAAKFYLDWGKEKFAQIYMTEAYYCYARWGAKAKVVDLETRYPQLLVTILQKQQLSFKPTETVISIGSKKIQSSTISHTGFSEALDLASILKASQLLSSEIELDKLLSSLLNVILKIAGAQKCALLMPT